MKTPIAPITLVWGSDGLVQADFTASLSLAQAFVARHKLGTIAVQQTRDSSIERALRRYFSGDLDVLNEIPVAPIGTEFSCKVWQQLCWINAGTTKTYGDIANILDSPGAARAVGMACHNNPIGLVIPCHRVVGHDGSLTGYAGGIHIKRWLLNHEGVECALPDGGQISLFT